jgi:hypothetical protein
MYTRMVPVALGFSKTAFNNDVDVRVVLYIDTCSTSLRRRLELHGFVFSRVASGVFRVYIRIGFEI